MEPAPPTAPTERAPSEPSKPKSRWNFFELFKKEEDASDAARRAPVKPGSKESATRPEAPAEKLSVSERRRLGRRFLKFLRPDEQKPSEPDKAPMPRPDKTALETGTESPAARKETAKPPVPELAPLPLLERAKEVGRNVLRLVRGAKDNVENADTKDRVALRTDVTPLVEADKDVRAAMRELIAPIEEYEMAHGSHTAADTAEDEPAEKTTVLSEGITPSHETAGDSFEELLPKTASPFARTFEVATAAANVASLDALRIKERMDRTSGRMMKAGIIAIGMAGAVDAAVTHYRLRAMKKRQRDMARAHERFETEVREKQEKDEQRLRRLETTDVQRLAPAERSTYVQEVSEFAHGKAREIRAAARTVEVIQPTSMAAQTPEAVDTVPAPAADTPRIASFETHAEKLRAPYNPEEIPTFIIPKEARADASDKPETPHSMTRGTPEQRRPFFAPEQPAAETERSQRAAADSKDSPRPQAGGFAASGSRLADTVKTLLPSRQRDDLHAGANTTPPAVYTRVWLKNAIVAAGIIGLTVLVISAIV